MIVTGVLEKSPITSRAVAVVQAVMVIIDCLVLQVTWGSIRDIQSNSGGSGIGNSSRSISSGRRRSGSSMKRLTVSGDLG